MKTIFETGKVALLAMVAIFTLSAHADTKNNNQSAKEKQQQEELAKQKGQQAQAINDGQITAVLVAVDNNEIAAAQLALTKAQDQAVKTFAQKLIDDHTKMNNMVASVMQTTQIQSVPSQVSQGLQQKGQAELAELSKITNAKDFEIQYISKELANHQALLTMIDQTLLPSASNPALKQLIQNARPVVQQHLDMAKQIQTTLKK